MDEAVKVTAQAIEHVNSELQLAALIAVCILIAFGLYLAKVAGDGKKLVSEKEKAEIERTEHRKKERDHQIDGITARFDAEIKEIRGDFAEHMETHKTADNRLYDRLGKIEDNMHGINVSLAEIKIRMEMTETEKSRHEQNR